MALCWPPLQLFTARVTNVMCQASKILSLNVVTKIKTLVHDLVWSSPQDDVNKFHPTMSDTNGDLKKSLKQTITAVSMWCFLLQSFLLIPSLTSAKWIQYMTQHQCRVKGGSPWHPVCVSLQPSKLQNLELQKSHQAGCEAVKLLAERSSTEHTASSAFFRARHSCKERVKMLKFVISTPIWYTISILHCEPMPPWPNLANKKFCQSFRREETDLPLSKLRWPLSVCEFMGFISRHKRVLVVVPSKTNQRFFLNKACAIATPSFLRIVPPCQPSRSW